MEVNLNHDDSLIDSKSYGKTIALIRKVKGITQQQLAVLCDVSHVFISQIERGNKLPSQQLKLKLQEAFNMSNLEFDANLAIFGAIHIDRTKYKSESIDFIANLHMQVKEHFDQLKIDED